MADSLWYRTDHGPWLVKLNAHKGANQEKMTSAGSSIFCSLPIFFPLHSLDATLKRPMSSYATIILYLILPSRKQGFLVKLTYRALVTNSQRFFL